ncbi:metal ABC transporter solute-binding protein, Zn/Mn family [Dongia sp.]|uniref:metal ABC transporter solute-binding protein, Zn/Mn family n=1 Tax=Dongia sp. TaxID=1977262 RepID=UPI0035B20F33
MRFRPFGLVLVLLSGLFVALHDVRADDKLEVVATFSVVADLTQRIGGEAIDLTTLVGANEDAHAYEPTAEAQRAVAAAQIVVANGLGFEPWLDRLVDAAQFKGDLVVATKGIEPLALPDEHAEEEIAGGADDHEHGANDPHAFQDPKLVLAYIDNIEAALAKAAPAHATAFAANAERLKADFRALDAELSASIGGLPADRKHILTSHDAFGYFGRAYGIDFIGVQGISTDSEPSAQDLKNVIEQIKVGKIKAMFIENMSDPRFIESIAADTGIAVGGDLFADALSGPEGPAGDLLSLFRHNERELLKALR